MLACRSLIDLGATLTAEQQTAQYFRAVCELDSHRFTINVVLDENLFRIGTAQPADNVMVANLETLLMTKAATLVSRCSEKDLYDLYWLVTKIDGVELGDLITLGQRVDAGVDAEAMLLVITGTQLLKNACSFAVEQGQGINKVFKVVNEFKDTLQKMLVDFLEGLPVPPLGKLVRKLRQICKAVKVVAS
ncbi:MAG: nucleotidyl transferase AbiEii/AbiGii toxin family protein [Deltaproteobacteria bacterium]|nr:nucleotidyl transferase AbiEii/AbiGii toxin family protein [Deltaproteobacteria bacterium]